MEPRCIEPGRTWLITRRTTRRYFLLRPDADRTSQNLYWYTTAVTAAKFGIVLHAVQVLSTHMHEVLTDVRGMLPAFLRERNRLLANALKCHRRWSEEVFQRAPTSCVVLYGASAIANEIGYTLANCVEAGLVREPSQWPGVTVDAGKIGELVVTVKRPTLYFDPDNPGWPEHASLSIEMPIALVEAHGGRARDVLRAVVDSAVERARQIAREAGRVLSSSVAKLLAVPFTRQAESVEPMRQRNPRFATAGDPELTRIAAEAHRTFLHLYRKALDAARAGLSGIPFPSGTWRWLRELLTPRPPSDPPRCLSPCSDDSTLTSFVIYESAPADRP